MRIISETKADLESGLAKALGGGKLTPVELSELEQLTVSDMMKDHGLDSIMAEKVVLHAQSERYRMRAQRQYTVGTPDIDSSDFGGGYTRSHPIHERLAR